MFHCVALGERSNLSHARFLQVPVVRVQQSSHDKSVFYSIEARKYYDVQHDFLWSFNVTDHALTTDERESGSQFAPKFDANGLLTAVVVDHKSGDVLVVAHMNAEALGATIQSGNVHFWSRSRGKLWMKGETSGNVLRVEQILVDCDQDALLIRARPAGPTCHTGARSCFYREVISTGSETILTRHGA